MALGVDLDFGRLPGLERVARSPRTAGQQADTGESAGVVRTDPRAAPGAPGAEPRPAAQEDGFFSERELRIAAAIAEAAMPPGRFLEGAGTATADRLAGWISSIPPHLAQGLRAALWALELASVPLRLRPLSALPLEPRMEVLRGFEQSRSHALRSLLRAVLTPLRFLHYDRPQMFEHVGCRYELPTVRDEQPRWLAQVTDGREIEEDLELECEVLVIGTGAGGAAAAYELASRGHAVLMLEEGDYHRRSSFNGRPARAYRDLYRDHGLDMALGNVGIPVFAGRAVGGSTVINSGTCYRAPERTLASWRDGMGLPAEFSSEGLAPYYERVERMLQVAPADPLHLGAIGPIIQRGAERLGYRHGPLPRNAPGCDGQGVCCFGCPTGAKRSTDVSYVPEALKRGAQLITAARVTAIDVVAGRARGATARLGGAANGGGRAASGGGRAASGGGHAANGGGHAANDGGHAANDGGRAANDGGRAARRGPRLTVRAEAVVVAGGALMTPLLLRRSGACLTSGMLGKNLSIHPASKVMALFDDRIDQWSGIPQGYQIDHFAEEGLMFEGGSLPFDVAALGVPWTGRRYTELMERYPHLATFGFMIQDTSRGEVRLGPGGAPLVLYNLNQRDLARMHRGIELLSEVFLAAGARRVLPLVAGCDEVNSREDLERLRARKLRPGDFDMAAFHPLGTCRIGVDPRSSCLGPDHQAHDVAGLYVCDGSAIPSSLGVNPQMTIMAMSLRAAEIIGERLSR